MSKNNKVDELPPIAGRLLALRKHFDKTQKEMAAWVGITQLAWFNYESGKSIPNGKVLAKLCEYGVNANWILVGQNKMLNWVDAEVQALPATDIVLTHAIEQVESWLDKNGKTIPAHKKAELLTHIYAESSETGSDITQDKVDRLLKLVAS